MSADNFVAVYPENHNWIITDGSMSIEMEDCQYRGSEVGRSNSRELALVEAHNYANTLSVLEYGVIELPAIPEEFCGRCFVCVHERSIIDPTLEHCEKCGKVISASEGYTMMMGAIFHNGCSPTL